MDLVSLFLILFQCLARMNMSSAQYFSCNNTNGNFTTGSAFGDSRNFILSSLSSNFTASGGFYSGSFGTGTDTVYAISFCKGGSKAKDCSACLNATAVDLMQKCPNQKEAIMWGAMVPTPCTIRYSNTPIQGKYETSPFILIHGPNKMNLNLTEFDQTWRNLTEGLAVEASNGSPELKYAMGESSMADVKFFAILQCSPDLSESYCRSCLEGSIDDYQSCCNGYPASAVLKPSCILRWDFYPFDSPNASSTPSPLPVPLPSSAGNEGNNDSSRIIIVIVVVIVAMVVLLAFVPSILKKRRERKQRQSRLQWEDDDEVSTVESLQFSLATIKAITDNFSEVNKLGQGGFGAVYKGRFPNGKEIAVKRLSATSRQGELEFKNEVLILAKLQHRNLVRLVGFCLEGTERLLIYEFVPNSSLDHFIFDPTKRMLLNWESRRKIIMGIARGMLYLHEDSRLRIIHRDLKASNILLDEDMNPKISDFGLARLFSQGQIRAATNRIVGTYGYMAPEYAMWGNFSLKTDVFSFGVLILEIASGQRNNNFRNGEAVQSLLSYVWKNWREETIWNIIDPSLNSALRTEIARFVHIGLLCVQKTVVDRPTMGYVVSVLTSEFITLQAPLEPPFMEDNVTECENLGCQVSENEVSITELYPR